MTILTKNARQEACFSFGDIFCNLLSVLKAINPGYVVIYGDTNSSMASALTAENIKSKIIHVEAGVRDFDLHVPEEPLRIQIDEMADYFFLHQTFVRPPYYVKMQRVKSSLQGI